MRDYTHVHDIVAANMLAMTNPQVGHGEMFNIGNGRPFSVNQLVALIGGDFVSVPERPGDVRETRADYGYAQSVLGWEPTISLEEGIAQLKAEMGIE